MSPMPAQRSHMPSAPQSFAGQPNRRPEIWAYGLRNPWRYAFDPVAGFLYIADVGEHSARSGHRAGTASALNYGWSILEGSLCLAVIPCAPQALPRRYLNTAMTRACCAIIGGSCTAAARSQHCAGGIFIPIQMQRLAAKLSHNGGQAVEQLNWNIPSVGFVPTSARCIHSARMRRASLPC